MRSRAKHSIVTPGLVAAMTAGGHTPSTKTSVRSSAPARK